MKKEFFNKKTNDSSFLLMCVCVYAFYQNKKKELQHHFAIKQFHPRIVLNK